MYCFRAIFASIAQTVLYDANMDRFKVKAFRIPDMETEIELWLSSQASRSSLMLAGRVDSTTFGTFGVDTANRWARFPAPDDAP